MFRSLSTRLLLTYLLVSGVVLSLVSISLFFFLVRNPLVDRLVYQRLEAVADTLLQREIGNLASMRAEAAGRSLDRLDQALSVRLMLVNLDARLVADSRAEQGSPPLSFLSAVATSGGGYQQSFVDPSGRSWLAVVRPLADQLIMVCAQPRPTARTFALLSDEFLAPVLQAAAVALVASLIMSWMITRWIGSPLQRFAISARSIAEGEFVPMATDEGPEEVKSLARAINEMVAQMQASQQSQRDFVANVSHDLKTPLTSIQGFAQAILDGTAGDSAGQRRAAQVIFDESDRLRRLVEDLLELARLDSGQVKFQRLPVDIVALLSNICERLSPSASEKGVRLDRELPQLPVLIGDGDRLAQVFTNLLDNAIKHTPPAGAVALRANTSAGWIFIHVDDSGPGIPESELSRIFERFYQLDKARPGGMGRGVGLGLAISREIIQVHGGQLLAQSRVGVGSRFTVQLPIVRPDDETLVIPDRRTKP